MHIVLVEPEIPQNTGNISRTCVLSNATLHLIKPLGFSLEDKYLKRAGLDYWKYLKLKIYDKWEDFYQNYSKNRFFFFSVKGKVIYTDIAYEPDDVLVFGSETKGLNECFFSNYNSNQFIRLPMNAKIERSLNLSNTVAVAVFEAMRQRGFPGMK